MNMITFSVTACEETGGYVARWDAPSGGGITTQGDNLTELNEMIADAVRGWFSEGERPQSVKLHFVEDPELAVA